MDSSVKDSSSRLDSDDLSNQNDLNEVIHSSESPIVLSLEKELASKDCCTDPDDNTPKYCAKCGK
ncbi:MAG: hypothetical protein AB2693_33655, partial [Candidatus Thiodiazotropha sp.]